jgi:hypothetical protein
MKAHWLLVVALVSTPGCGATAAKVVPVSGVVTFDGKPLANATVLFSPVAKAGEINAGDGSAGKTNEQGEYTLTTSRGVPGAQVGKHRVSISVLSQAGSSDQRPPAGGWPAPIKVPARYNTESQLTFDVPAAGTTAANFDLTTK